jgi:hypothetical protein
MSEQATVERIPPQHQDTQPGREEPMTIYMTGQVLHPNGGEIVNA